MQFYLPAIVVSVLMAVGQIAFKSAAVDVKAKFAEGWMASLLSPWIIASLAIYAVTTALWIYILTFVPLSKAYPFALLGAGLVPLLSWLMFKETISMQYVAGMILLIAALLMIQSA